MIKRLAVGLAVCALVGFGLPRLELAYACRRPASEDCVWGKALISLNVAATTVIIGMPTGAFAAWYIGRTKRTRNNAPALSDRR
jgi:hypothetical protein